MEFPYGHHHHHHHHHQSDDDDGDDEERRQYYPPPGTAPPPSSHYHQQETAEFQPPPRPSGFYQEDRPEYPPPPTRPYYQQPEYAPPRTEDTHVYHTSHDQEFDSSVNYMQPPTTQVTHVSHEQGDPAETHHSYRPHLPSFMHHHQSGRPESGLDLSNKPGYKIYCRAEPNHYLTIRDEKVVLATADPSDEYQYWYKDEKYSTRVKDEEGFPAFSLVNKVTGQAVKHSIGATHPVQLVPYNPDILDESVLWTESKDMGDGYRAVRMVNNVHLNVDAFHGDKKSGGVHDGTIIVLWQWNKGDNQRWKITPYCKFLDLV